MKVPGRVLLYRVAPTDIMCIGCFDVDIKLDEYELKLFNSGCWILSRNVREAMTRRVQTRFDELKHVTGVTDSERASDLFILQIDPYIREDDKSIMIKCMLAPLSNEWIENASMHQL